MARYDFGVEKRIYLNSLSEEEVDSAVAELVNQADSINSALPGGHWDSWKELIFKTFHIQKLYYFVLSFS